MIDERKASSYKRLLRFNLSILMEIPIANWKK